MFDAEIYGAAFAPGGDFVAITAADRVLHRLHLPTGRIDKLAGEVGIWSQVWWR